MTRDLENFCIWRENIEIGWQHLKKKVLETLISYKHTRKSELNGIDFKITKNYKNASERVWNNYGGGVGGVW